MSEWIKLDRSNLPLNQVLEFSGCDWSPFRCTGKIIRTDRNIKPKKYANKIKFYIKRKDGSLEPDKKTWVDITHYREIKTEEE